jgi:hypothetical protein
MKNLFFSALLLSGFQFIAQNTLPTTGNVGIGTTTPETNLDVKGCSKLDTVYIRETFTVDKATTLRDSVTIQKTLKIEENIEVLGDANFRGNFKLLNLIDTSTTIQLLTIKPNGLVEKGGVSVFANALYEPANCFVGLPHWVSTNSTVPSSIYTDPNCTANVGIGIIPAYKLDVEGFSRFSGSIGIGTQPQGYAKTLIQANPGQIGVQLNMLNATQYQIGFFASVEPPICNPPCDNAKLFVGHNATIGQDVFRVLSSGAVEAKSLRLSLNIWADHVFEPNYSLMSLDSLQQYITLNKHLPNIPTTSEVTAEGVDVGNINVQLLTKIEELTLYILELKKELEAVKNEVEVLKLD